MPAYCLRCALIIGAIVTGAAQAIPPGMIPPSVLKEVETGKPSSPSAARSQQQKIDALKEKALADDFDTSIAAIRELKAMGSAARLTLVGVLRQVLARDLEAIDKSLARIGDVQIASEYERQIDQIRAEARQNVTVLDKEKPETLKKARQYYDQLTEMVAKMNEAWNLRFTITQAMGRRNELLGLWRDVAPAGDKQFSSQSEAKVRERATQAVGDFIDRVADLRWAKEPTDPALKPVWFFGMCRKIESWNNALAPTVLDTEETRNLAFVNKYREALGILPFELDPRLVQAARRHSKDMVEKGFFSHESPLPGLASPSDRMRAAGYPGGGGENIAYGAGTGEGTFWMWFNSPGHHKNMAGGYTHFGVGRWNSHFTQNFGGSPRVMLMTPEERERQKIEGTLLKPQGK